MLKRVGTGGRLSLGKKHAGRYLKVEQQPDGGVLLRPMNVVPDDESWAHEPAMRDQLRRAGDWAERAPPSATNVTKLISSAGKRR